MMARLQSHKKTRLCTRSYMTSLIQTDFIGKIEIEKADHEKAIRCVPCIDTYQDTLKQIFRAFTSVQCHFHMKRQ